MLLQKVQMLNAQKADSNFIGKTYNYEVQTYQRIFLKSRAITSTTSEAHKKHERTKLKRNKDNMQNSRDLLKISNFVF